jgi:O-antigen ligase
MRSITYALSLLLIFVIPWEGLVRLPGVGNGAKVLGIGVAIVWLITVIVTKRLRRPRPVQVVLLFFVIWNGITIFWSADPTRTLAHLLTWLQLLGMALMLWDLYTTRPAILAGLQMYVLGAYVAVGSAVRNYLTGDVFYTNYQRYSSGDTNPDGFGFILAMAIPLAWYLAAENNGRWGKVFRAVNYAYIPAAFMGLALSGTRTALLASLVGMMFGLISLTRIRLWIRIVITLVLVSSLFYLVPYVRTLKSFQRLGTTGTELTQGDLNNRTNNWAEGLANFQEHPYFGVGANMYRSVNSLDKVAHNSFVSVLVELGLVGFALFATIIVIIVSEAWSHRSLWERSFWMTLFTVWTMGAFTLTWEYRKSTWLFFSLLLASAALSKVREKQAEKVARPARSANQPALPEQKALPG